MSTTRLLAVEPLHFTVAPLEVVEVGEVVERGRDINMPGAKRLLPDGKGALVEWLGVGVAVLVLVWASEAHLANRRRVLAQTCNMGSPLICEGASQCRSRSALRSTCA